MVPGCWYLRIGVYRYSVFVGVATERTILNRRVCCCMVDHWDGLLCSAAKGKMIVWILEEPLRLFGGGRVDLLRGLYNQLKEWKYRKWLGGVLYMYGFYGLLCALADFLRFAGMPQHSPMSFFLLLTAPICLGVGYRLYRLKNSLLPDA